MKHPSIRDLALYSSGDLALFKRLWLGRHIESCDVCRAELNAFREAQLELEYSSGELPPNLHWNRLAAEMTANIRLGLAAGECVRGASPAPAPAVHTELWRYAPVAAAAAFLIIGGWWWQTKPALKPLATPVESEVVLKATLGGIGVERNGGAFALAASRGETLAISAETNGVLKAGYVDEESGQVTIHHVYAE
jgi:hypothetical protein